MDGYGWDQYDVRTGGRQIIHDKDNGLDLTTEFIKVPGGAHGGSWAARIKGVPRSDRPANLKSTVVFSVTLEGLGMLSSEAEGDESGTEGSVLFQGMTQELGKFKVEVTEGPATNRYPAPVHAADKENPLDRTLVASSQVPEEALWQDKAVLFTTMKTRIDKFVASYGAENSPPPWQMFRIEHSPGPGNLHFVQKVFEGAFEFDILFSSESASQDLTPKFLSSEINKVTDSFASRFASVLAPKGHFKGSKYEKFSQSLFSNLLGGIGYFYGDSKVDRSYAPEYEEENEGFWEETADARGRHAEELEGPTELFTSIPSRPFFPRGFLWDEGFHLLPIADWDMDLTLQIVRSWFELIDDDGWIGREQILGAEARSKVPEEFQTQYPHYANPPTLFLIIETFLSKLAAPNVSGSKAGSQVPSLVPGIQSAHIENHELAKAYLRVLYPRLRKQWRWFRKTQTGDITAYDREAFSTKEAYRWRGRTPAHILTSGLDDYPRPQPPHPGELHVDLISWMGMMSRSLRRIAEFIGEDEDVSEYAKSEVAIGRNIEDLHWSEKEGCYCDATIDDYEESSLVCHKGYISLFPFMTGMLDPKHKHLKKVLDLIEDPEELWSPYGIRSLSAKSQFYGTEENYWRSPIWININYLIVWRLLETAQAEGPHKTQAKRMYTSLRKNLCENVYNQWVETGFAWEQYNPEDGHGQRTQHFTGWTSLIVKIMAFPDLETGDGVGHDEL
ncbi:MAG: Processing alpha glucosidase I [Vezdaea aestivalis]|nr:MAG: Processing alpha glucosidase I [Vezdaea aestivalis]